ncbi:hypothetical protein BY458DRAFT_517240 [Sporodiniella umbellata]|nr:hypothetical protein BY458DRAFT_517240 [Sporodiniella umbellata]
MLDDVLVPALPFCPLPRFNKGGNLVPKQWWLDIKLSNEPQGQTMSSADPFEYKIQIWLDRITKHERIRESEILREFIETEIGFRPNLRELSKRLPVCMSEEGVDPESALWIDLLKSFSDRLNDCLTIKDKLFHSHRVMAEHWMDAASSFVSYGAIESNSNLFLLCKSVAKGLQKASDLQKLQALASYETMGEEMSYQVKNAKSVESVLVRKSIVFSEYVSSKKHTESSLRAAERLKSSININRERANDAIAILESARVTEQEHLKNYEDIDINIRKDIQDKYKPNVANDLKNTLRDFVQSQIYLETRKMEAWQSVLRENKAGLLLYICYFYTNRI